jgi:hypothetical protein
MSRNTIIVIIYYRHELLNLPFTKIRQPMAGYRWLFHPPAELALPATIICCTLLIHHVTTISRIINAILLYIGI